MNFTMLIASEFIPIVMLVIGILFKFRSPKEINSILGYRTRLSMKNEETWNFAQNHFSKVWIVGGIALAVISLAAYCVLISNGRLEEVIHIMMYTQLAVLFLSCIPTNFALRKRFGKK